jgi:F-type H+-transporting ATPase subunit gamma
MPGGNLRDLRRRIRSVKSTQQITRAMKLVAVSKLRRAQMSMEAARPFAAGVRDLLGNLARRVVDETHPLMRARDGRRTLLLVVTADRGLAGSFNHNLLRTADWWLLQHRDARDLTVQVVGKKGRDHYQRRKWKVRKAQVDLFRSLDFSVSQELAQDLMQAFLAEGEEGFDEVLVYSNRFRTVMSQDVVLERLLPAGAPEAPAAGVEPPGEYLYEPDPAALLEVIVPRAVETLVHQVLLESLASEMAARMVAMGAATKNAEEMIAHLTLMANRMRQASITTEINEIVSGAQALEGKG